MFWYAAGDAEPVIVSTQVAGLKVAVTPAGRDAGGTLRDSALPLGWLVRAPVIEVIGRKSSLPVPWGAIWMGLCFSVKLAALSEPPLLPLRSVTGLSLVSLT